MGSVYFLISVLVALQACNSLVLSQLAKTGIVEGANVRARSLRSDANIAGVHGGKRGKLRVPGTHQPSFLASSIADQVSTVDATWADLTANGEKLTSMTKTSLFFRSLAAGVFTGFGGCLCASVGFDMALKPWEAGAGIARLVSGVIGMPLAFLLINITGNGAWTGDALSVVRAFLKNRKTANALRMLSITYIGCAVGTGLVAMLAAAGKLACCKPIMAIASNKIGLGLSQVFARSIGGGALICLAILTSKQSPTISGKAINIIFPISAYVTIGFEHYLSSLFFFQTAMASGLSIPLKRLAQFTIVATLGNFLGGAFLVGCGMSQMPKKSMD